MTAKDAISELDRLVPDSVPTIKIEDISSDRLSLYYTLIFSEIPVPYWLQIGESKYQITKDNYEAIAKGMLIAMDVKLYFDSKTRAQSSTK